MTIRLTLAGLALLLLAGCATVPNPFAGRPVKPAAAAPATPAAPAPRASAASVYMDKQETELRTQLQGSGLSVTRVGNQIVLNLPAAIIFDGDKSVARPEAAATLAAIGLVLKHFDQTKVSVYGYTDAEGAETDNRNLSQRRAVAVATALANQGLDQSRFYIEGRGSADPIATNTTDVGRAQNRRVEIQLTPTVKG